MIVVDASVMVAYLINEDGDDIPAVLGELIVKDGVLAPPHWHAEVGNALVTNLRRGRISLDRLDRMLTEIARLPISIAAETTGDEFATTINFALDHSLTFYDAAYVRLAIDGGAVLATLDAAMRRAARRCELALIP